ncbi:hypothetical protein ABMA27_014201 [Loxostege sticticalis]|uniref:Uncharacterized protein n=1 Tax=Loxostege sticticalis TaxID=481309 RepID=A0ABR3ID34_LOXSC
MWLGATVATGHNFTVACAPRYTERKSPLAPHKLGTFGRCYATSSGPKMDELPTATEELSTPYEKNMDSFGWSINVDRKDSITVGGPAMNRGRAMIYKNSDADPQVLITPKGVKFNFGYSVTSGNFLTGNRDDLIYAISSPYGQIGYGMVMLSNLSNNWMLTKPRWHKPGVGSLFGAAMASATLRGPGQRQALLIGAPTFAEKGGVNVGAVYIYQFDPALKNVVHQKTILGKKDNGQFGSAIISLGDLNGDRKDEIAVSAPYEDSGRGAVYVYSGGHLLSDVADSMLRSLQRIQPEGYRSFGLSIAALQDYDDNGCNELAIGAPHSDKFAILRCMANIIVNVNNLQGQTRMNETYFVFQSCMDFVFPVKPKIVRADIMLKVSISHKDATLANSTGNNKFIERKVEVRDKTLRRCVDVGIITPKVIGYEPSIQYQITATQINGPTKDKTFDPSHVLLSDISVLHVSDMVWAADCAGVGKCKPKFDLSIQSTIKDGYIIGSTDTETVSFTAGNSGDVAYTACARVDLAGVRVGRWPPTCSLISDVLICVPRQPVENNTVWQSEEIELDMKSLKSSDKNITVSILIYLHCQSKENYIASERNFSLQPYYEGLNMDVTTNDVIKLTNEELTETGKHTSHVYTVYNVGVTVWANLRCVIVMQPKFVNKDFSVDSRSPFQCGAITLKDGLYTSTCIITELRRNHKFDVIIPIFIEPESINADDLDEDNTDKVTVSSSLKLIYDDKQQERSIVSALKLKEAAVPIWIVIIAALVGLLIIIIIAFALYECGFLRRKNKAKLKQLRRSVHRQSVRRSMALRESMRASAERRSGDREKLIGETKNNEDNTNTDIPKNGTEIPKTGTDLLKKDTEIPKKDTDLLKKDAEIPKKDTGLLKDDNVTPKSNIDLPKKDTDIPKKDTNVIKRHSQSPKKNTDLPNVTTELPNDSILSNEDQCPPKKVTDKLKILNNDHILRGLQKNVVQHHGSLTQLPGTQKETKDETQI